jgi:hypothetical protein
MISDKEASIHYLRSLGFRRSADGWSDGVDWFSSSYLSEVTADQLYLRLLRQGQHNQT